jgi:hypothetical protein
VRALLWVCVLGGDGGSEHAAVLHTDAYRHHQCMVFKPMLKTVREDVFVHQVDKARLGTRLWVCYCMQLW